MAYKFQMGTAILAGQVEIGDPASPFELSGSDDIRAAGGLFVGPGLLAYGITKAGAANVTSMAGDWTNAGNTVADLGIVSAATSITSTAFVGTLSTAAQPNITSLGTIASLVATTADINDGTVDAVIGGTTPKAGTFTALTDSGLTQGRVTVASAGGLLADTANFTYDGTDLLVKSGDMSASADVYAAGNMVSKHGQFKGAQLSGSEALYLGAAAVLSVSGNVFLPNNSITNDNLAGSIANAKLANSSITLTQGAGMAAMGAVSLGDAVTVAVDGNLADIDGLSNANGGFIVGDGAAFVIESGNTACLSLGLGSTDSPTFAGVTINGNMSASGDLYVAGTLTSVNTDELVIKDKQVIIGSGSASKAIAADSAIRFAYAADNSDFFEFAYDQNGTGDAAASGDILIARDETGALIDIQAANIYGTVTGDIVANINAIADAAGALEVGFNYGSATELTADRAWTLPASPTIGQVVHVKAPSLSRPVSTLILPELLSTQRLLMERTICVISHPDFGAVSLMYIASNLWRVF